MTRLPIKEIVFKETVVALHQWGSCTQTFGFINELINVNWPPYRDSKGWGFDN